MTFNMASMPSSPSDTLTALGPLVDDGAEYSAVGLIELKLFELKLNLDIDDLDPIPSSLTGVTHWQFCVGDHASASRRILGSTVIAVKADSGRLIQIRHLVIVGCSQCVIGRNDTSKDYIIHVGRNATHIIQDGVEDCISMVNRVHLSFIPLSSFGLNGNDDYEHVLSCLSGNTLVDKPWSHVKSVVDKVHKHICSHANLTDFRLHLQRNEMWNEAVANYVYQLVGQWISCRATAPP